MADGAAGTVSLLSGVGDGTFTGPVAPSVGPGPAAVVAVDLDGDGFCVDGEPGSPLDCDDGNPAVFPSAYVTATVTGTS